MADVTERSTKTEDPLGPGNRCRDFDEDCADINADGYCTACWMHDPTQGWCPYLLGKTD